MRYIVATLIALVVGFILYAAIKSDMEARAEWERFRVEHECHVVAKKQGTTSVGTAIGTGVGSNGQAVTTVTPIVTTTPGQTAWECNDGITYWRNN